MVVTGVTVIGLLAFYQGQYREITWKDFVVNYLSRGVVSLTSFSFITGTGRCCASTVYAMTVCLSPCPSVCHKLVFYQNG